VKQWFLRTEASGAVWLQAWSLSLVVVPRAILVLRRHAVMANGHSNVNVAPGMGPTANEVFDLVLSKSPGLADDCHGSEAIIGFVAERVSDSGYF
jgi:hypothetical protein